MRWPKLVPPTVCTTPIRLTFEGEPGEDGAPLITGEMDGMCNYSEKSKWIMDAERGWIRLQAAALFDGDILPGKDVAGTAVIGGLQRRIYGASRGRNPDGTVNYTQVELM